MQGMLSEVGVLHCVSDGAVHTAVDPVHRHRGGEHLRAGRPHPHQGQEIQDELLHQTLGVRR